MKWLLSWPEEGWFLIALWKRENVRAKNYFWHLVYSDATAESQNREVGGAFLVEIKRTLQLKGAIVEPTRS